MKICSIKIPAYGCRGRTLWTQVGFDASAFAVKTTGSQEVGEFEVDEYLYSGAGRSALYNGVYLKGIGKTPFVNEERPDYATGTVTLTDAMVEVINLTAIQRWFPKSIKPKAIILTNDKVVPNLESASKSVINNARDWDHGCILARDFPERLTHLLPFEKLESDEILKMFSDKNPELPVDTVWGFWRAWARKCANQFAFLLFNRFSMGGTHVGNFDMSGIPFDLATATFVNDFRNVYTVAGGVSIWDEGKEALVYMLKHIAAIYKKSNYNNSQLLGMAHNEVNDIWNDALYDNCVTLLGITSKDIEHLHPLKVLRLKSTLLSYLKQDTITYPQYDVYTSYYENPELVGYDFMAEIPKLVTGSGVTSSGELNAAWYELNYALNEAQRRKMERACSSRVELIHELNLVCELVDDRRDSQTIDFAKTQKRLATKIALLDRVF